MTERATPAPRIVNSVHLLVQERACASGEPTDGRIEVIVMPLRALNRDSARCAGQGVDGAT